MKRILISGGRGFIGNNLCFFLKQNGYECHILTRNPSFNSNFKEFFWDPESFTHSSLSDYSYDAIIHLSASSIGGKRWSADYKKTILDSRINSARLLAHIIKTEKIVTPVIISMAGVGYYGYKISEGKTAAENDEPGNDYIARVSFQWEEELKKLQRYCDRNVILRSGIVLSNTGGAFPQLLKPFKYYAGAVLGNGKQVFNWLSLSDLLQFILFSIQNEHVSGIYNLVADEQISNKDLTAKLSKYVNKRTILPAIPEWLLKIVLGEFADLLLNGNAISNQRVKDSGFVFQDKSIDDFIQNCC